MPPSPSSGQKRALPLRVLRWTLALVCALVLLPYVIAPVYLAGRPVSTLMLWRWVSGQPVQRVWMPLDQMGELLPRTVLVAEDARFCVHRGVDWAAFRAAVDDVLEGEPGGGGSTITQQTAKNLFLWGGRSYVRKALEVPLALWIDLLWPKRRILEIYLNVAEWGPGGAFGAEAGARQAFGKSVNELGAREAALLAAALPNPLRRRAGRPGGSMQRLAARYEARARAGRGVDACLGTK